MFTTLDRMADADIGMLSTPLGPYTFRMRSAMVAVTPAGTATGFFPMRDMAQNTWQRTSPPTFASRASASERTPFGVETMTMPRPFLTRGSSSAPE